MSTQWKATGNRILWTLRRARYSDMGKSHSEIQNLLGVYKLLPLTCEILRHVSGK